jgi:tetratricopeptide (TPR) repeat protein
MALATSGFVAVRSILLALCISVLTPAMLAAQSRVMELNEAGWKLLQSGDSGRAAGMFAEALSMQPDNPVLLFGAGVAAHLQGRNQDASARLRRALDVNPGLTQASLLLGQIAYHEGNIADAIATYEKAQRYAPDHPELATMLKAWRADADANSQFVERRFDRFRVMFQGRTDKVLAARATEILESAFWRIGKVLGSYPSDPIVVMLYTEKQFRDVTQAPEWAAGLYDGRIRIPAAGAAQSPQLFEQVLVHELTHAMIAGIAPRGVPAWIHEGLARHFEGDNVAVAQRRLKTFGVIPLRYLENGYSDFTAAQAILAYDQSLVVVETLLRRPGMDWNALFRALSESHRTEYTFDNFGLRYSELEAEIATSLSTKVLK